MYRITEPWSITFMDTKYESWSDKIRLISKDSAPVNHACYCESPFIFIKMAIRNAHASHRSTIVFSTHFPNVVSVSSTIDDTEIKMSVLYEKRDKKAIIVSKVRVMEFEQRRYMWCTIKTQDDFDLLRYRLWSLYKDMRLFRSMIYKTANFDPLTFKDNKKKEEG